MSTTIPLIIVSLIFFGGGAWHIGLFVLFLAWLYYNPEEERTEDEK